MAKEKERKLAEWLFVHKGLPLKEISIQVEVSVKTLSVWANKYKWKGQRTAILSNPKHRIDNVKQIITNLADERLELSNKIKQAELDGNNGDIADYRKHIAQIDVAVANWNKTLATIDKDTRVTLAQYLFVMDKIFTAFSKYDEDLFLKTISFQERHLNDIVIELG